MRELTFELNLFSVLAALKIWRGKADKRKRGRRSTEEDSVTTTSTSSTHTEETDEMTPLKARQWFRISFPNKDAQSRSDAYPEVHMPFAFVTTDNQTIH